MGTRLRRTPAAEYLGRTPRWLKDATAQGLIPHYRVGRMLVYDTDDLDAFLAANRVEASDGPLAPPSEPKSPRRRKTSAA